MKNNDKNIHQKITQNNFMCPQRVFEQIRLVESYNTQNIDPKKLIVRLSHSSKSQIKGK